MKVFRRWLTDWPFCFGLIVFGLLPVSRLFWWIFQHEIGFWMLAVIGASMGFVAAYMVWLLMVFFLMKWASDE